MIKKIQPVTPKDTGGDVVRANFLLTMRIGAAVNELIERHNRTTDAVRFYTENGQKGFDPNDATRGIL